MDNAHLMEIQERAGQTLMFPSPMAAEWIRETRQDVYELVTEVARLQARLKDVRKVVEEPAKYGDDVPAQRVLEAVEGYRAVTLDELKEKVLSGVSDAALCKWINQGKARVRSDGAIVIDDVSGLSMEILQGPYGASL